jgi:SAM-dependent methyltransferase
MLWWVKQFLKHPLTADCQLDDCATTATRRRILQEKVFLRRIYSEWYGWIEHALPSSAKPVLELGSGAGFLADLVPRLITSDVAHLSGLDALVDAHHLPFEDRSLGAIVMTNVLHHLQRVESFFHEAIRCLEPGGAVLMVEPWLTPASRFVYRYLQEERCDPDTRAWGFDSAGPLTSSNIALPWIIFERDRDLFCRCFPQLFIHSVRPIMPVRYLLSGGIGSRVSLPAWSFPLWRSLERRVAPWNDRIAMFAQIQLVRSGISNQARSSGKSSDMGAHEQ